MYNNIYNFKSNLKLKTIVIVLQSTFFLNIKAENCFNPVSAELEIRQQKKTFFIVIYLMDYLKIEYIFQAVLFCFSLKNYFTIM